MSLTLETLYLELSLLRTSLSLNNATVCAGLPLNTHVRTASEPEVVMRLGVTDVLVEIAGETSTDQSQRCYKCTGTKGRPLTV